MKKLIFYLFFLNINLAASAQEQNISEFKPSNIVKFLPLSLPFNSISFEYERMISAKNSISMEIGIPDKKSIIGKYGIPINSDLKTAEFSVSALRGAFRHYTGKKSLPKGFYIEPYFKYQHLEGKASIDGVDNQGDNYSGKSDINFNTINIGCQLGFQFLIAKRISLDLYFLGLEGGLINGNITTTPTSYTEYDPIILGVLKNVIDQKISEAPSIIRNNVSTTVTQNSILLKAHNVPYPWYRGGISIGFVF